MKKLFAVILTLILAVSLIAPVATPASAANMRALVGMWHFDSNAGDSSGYGNTGSVNGTSYVPGLYNQAIKFNGAGSFVNVLDSPSLDATTGLTLEAWIKLDSFASPSTFVISKSRPPALPFQSSYSLYIIGTGPSLGRVGLQIWKDATTTSVVNGATTLATGQWYHIAATYEFLTDGNSVMKVFVNGMLDGMVTTARGPIYVGTANLSIGRNALATIDEAHVWNMPHPVYSVYVTPVADTNPAGTQHTLTATVRANTGDASIPKPYVPGVPVNFLFSDTSVNQPPTSPVPTNANGQAQFTYSDTSAEGGVDTIAVWVDQDWSGGTFAQPLDAFAIARKSWVENFVTGGGKINVENGKKAAWSFSGMLGVLPGGGVNGNFEIVNHAAGVTYHSDNFSQLSFAGPDATSPDASNNLARFIGNFTSDNGNWVILRIEILDLGEPGAKVDKIRVSQPPVPAPPPVWPPPPGPPPLAPGSIIWIGSTSDPATAQPVPIDGGNLQVHNTE